MKSIASRWFPDRLRIALCPGQIVVSRLDGLRVQIVEKRIFSSDCSPQSPVWQCLLALLPEVLRDCGSGVRTASVILSNHFVRFAVVPWRDEVIKEGEREALARHCLRAAYGNSVNDSDICVSDSGFRKNALASTVERPFLAGIRDIFASAGISVTSIQPYFMSAFNRFRNNLSARPNLCLAIAEPRRATIGLYDEAGWQLIAGRRLINDGGDSLSRVILQEVLSCRNPDAFDRVVVAALSEPRMKLSIDNRVVEFMQLGAKAGFSPYDDAPFAMALCGVI